MGKSSIRVRKMMVIGIVAAMGYILMMFDFPILPAFSYLKVDFSDVPILISMFIFGPSAGIVATVIKVFLNIAMKGFSLGTLIGNGTSLVSTLAYTLPVYYLWRRSDKFVNKIISLVAGTLSLTVCLALFNYFIATPLYLNVMGMDFGMSTLRLVMLSIIPFNLIKGPIVGIAFYLAYDKLYLWLARQKKRNVHNAQ